MISTVVDPRSHAAFAPAPQSRAPESSAERPQPATASGELAPAVVNHVRSEAAVDERGEPADGRATPDKVDSAEAKEVGRLRARDAEVRAHEQAHAATGGGYAGAPSYGFERGPDGRNYAVSGEVQIDMSPIANDPEATIRKMQQVKRAALAPQDPSGADRAIAASADAAIVAARLELSATGSKGETEVQSSTDTAHASAGSDAALDAFSSYERRNAGAATYSQAAAPARGNVIDVVS
jgi:SprA-related family